MITVPLKLIQEETDKKGYSNGHFSGQLVSFLPGRRQVSVGHRQVSVGHQQVSAGRRKPMKGHCINDSFSSGHNPSRHSHSLPLNQIAMKSLLPLRPILLITITTVLLCLIHSSSGLSVGGVWSPRHDFVKVIAKFGFLKSDVHHKDRTDGYVFGNVTVISSSIDQHKFKIHAPINDPQSISGKSISGKSINDSPISGHNHTITHAVTSDAKLMNRNSSNGAASTDRNSSNGAASTDRNSSNGAASTDRNDSPMGALILVDRFTFIKMIGNEEEEGQGRNSNGGRNPSLTCDQIFDAMKGKTLIDDGSKCDNASIPAHRDLVRMIPCPQGQPCTGFKPSPNHRVPGSGVTFLIEDQKKPTWVSFLFLSFSLSFSFFLVFSGSLLLFCFLV